MEIPQLAAPTDHVVSKNHMIDWNGVRLPAKEPDWKKRGVKKAIFLKKVGCTRSTLMGCPTIFLMSS